MFFFLKLDFSDTQNGFKAFRTETIKNILPYATDISFAFDTELLMISEVMKKKIFEIPIYWEDSSKKTNVNLFRDPFKMLVNVYKQYKYKKNMMRKFNIFRSL